MTDTTRGKKRSSVVRVAAEGAEDQLEDSKKQKQVVYYGLGDVKWTWEELKYNLPDKVRKGTFTECWNCEDPLTIDN